MASESKAAKLRDQGNKKFKVAFATEQGLAPVLRQSNAEQAVQLYTQARASAPKPSIEWLAATRSIGVTQHRLAMSDWFRERCTYEQQRQLLTCFGYALQHFSNALEHASGVQSDEWMQGIRDKIWLTRYDLQQYVTQLHEPGRSRDAVYEKVIREQQLRGAAAVTLRLLIAEDMMKRVVHCDEVEDWRGALHVLGSQEQELAFAQHAGGSRICSEYQEQIEDLQLQRQLYVARSKAAQSLTIADELLQYVMEEEECLNMDLVWDIIDLYRDSMLRSQEFPDNPCYESEAKAASALGYTYSRVLKMRPHARRYLMHSMQLVNSITQATGATFFHERWYQRAREELLLIQTENVQEVEEALAKERAPTLEELKPELDAIKAIVRDPKASKALKAHKLLLHVYAEHAPKDGSEMVKVTDIYAEDKTEFKRALSKAVAAYHPDKLCNKQHGVKWKVLCEEITKEINCIYADFK